MKKIKNEIIKSIEILTNSLFCYMLLMILTGLNCTENQQNIKTVGSIPKVEKLDMADESVSQQSNKEEVYTISEKKLEISLGSNHETLQMAVVKPNSNTESSNRINGPSNQDVDGQSQMISGIPDDSTASSIKKVNSTQLDNVQKEKELDRNHMDVSMQRIKEQKEKLEKLCKENYAKEIKKKLNKEIKKKLKELKEIKEIEEIKEIKEELKEIKKKIEEKLKESKTRIKEAERLCNDWSADKNRFEKISRIEQEEYMDRFYRTADEHTQDLKGLLENLEGLLAEEKKVKNELISKIKA